MPRPPASLRPRSPRRCAIISRSSPTRREPALPKARRLGYQHRQPGTHSADVRARRRRYVRRLHSAAQLPTSTVPVSVALAISADHRLPDLVAEDERDEHGRATVAGLPCELEQASAAASFGAGLVFHGMRNSGMRGGGWSSRNSESIVDMAYGQPELAKISNGRGSVSR